MKENKEQNMKINICKHQEKVVYVKEQHPVVWDSTDKDN